MFAVSFPHWVDLGAIVVLALGFNSGRKHGISNELLNLIQWITILIVGAANYRRLGTLLANKLKIQPDTAFILVYIALMLVVITAFGYVRRAIGEKLVSKDLFGQWEYYLGMVAGIAKAVCILLVFLALINGVYISDEERAKSAAYQRENFGSISFPTLGDLQLEIFKRSFTGKMVKVQFSSALIAAAPPVDYPQDKENLRNRSSFDDFSDQQKKGK